MSRLAYHDGDVQWAGRQLGLDPHRANSAFQNLRKRLGERAR